MTRSDFGESKLVRASRIVSSKGAASTATSFIVVFVLLCMFGIFGIYFQTKQIDENYQKIFTDSGYSQPRSMDEAVYWMQLAEYPAWNTGPLLFTYREGEDLPNNYSTEYGWRVVAKTQCTKENASVVVEYFLGHRVIESLNLPVRNVDGVWEGSVETKSTRFVAYGNPYADSVYFTIRLSHR